MDTRPAGALPAIAQTFDTRDTGLLHLISANDAENAGISGSGTIDGQGTSFWMPRPDAKTPMQRYVQQALSRPAPMVDFVGCRNVTIEGVRLVNSPGWTLRLADCVGARINGISINNPVFGPNTDGVDIVASEDVEIANSFFTTGDDAICIKSASVDGRAIRPTRRIRIHRCTIITRCNGLKIGTASFGPIDDVIMSDCAILDDPRNEFSRAIAGVAIEMVDGGTLQNVHVRDITMRSVRTPIFIRRAARSRRPDGGVGILRDVSLERIHATGGITASSVTGLAGAPVENVRLTDLSLTSVRVEDGRNLADVPELATAYPEALMFGALPASGLFIRHVDGLRIENLALSAPARERRPYIVAQHVSGLKMLDRARPGANPSVFASSRQ